MPPYCLWCCHLCVKPFPYVSHSLPEFTRTYPFLLSDPSLASCRLICCARLSLFHGDFCLEKTRDFRLLHFVPIWCVRFRANLVLVVTITGRRFSVPTDTDLSSRLFNIILAQSEWCHPCYTCSTFGWCMIARLWCRCGN
jgi:hypothetical protein